MRPKSTTLDLPNSYNVKTYLHNQFVRHIADLKEQIAVSSFNKSRTGLTNICWKAAPGKISITSDAWSADTTKMGFMGMTAHWIGVQDRKWKLRAEVIGFKPISGKHSGENLGRHAVGLLDRVGIMSNDQSKV